MCSSEQDFKVEIHSKGFDRPVLEFRTDLATQWKGLLEASGFDVCAGPTQLERYCEAFEKGIAQEFGIAPPTEQQIASNARYLCSVGGTTLLITTHEDDRDGFTFHIVGKHGEATGADWRSVATQVEELLFNHGATRQCLTLSASPGETPGCHGISHRKYAITVLYWPAHVDSKSPFVAFGNGRKWLYGGTRTRVKMLDFRDSDELISFVASAKYAVEIPVLFIDAVLRVDVPCRSFLTAAVHAIYRGWFRWP